MKGRVCIGAMVLAVAAFAQDDRSAQPQSQTPTTPTMQDTKATAPGAPAEMKTQSYKGVLVDLACAGGAPSSATPASGNTPPNSAQATADRAAGQSSCNVSANSTQFGLRMKDGRTARFDMVGNQRAQDAVKAKKKWSEAAGAGKEINATVKGAMSGDKLIVSSIN